MAPSLNRSSSWSSDEHLGRAEQDEITPENAGVNMVESTPKENTSVVPTLTKNRPALILLLAVVGIFFGYQAHLMKKHILNRFEDSLSKERVKFEALSSKVVRLEDLVGKYEDTQEARHLPMTFEDILSKERVAMEALSAKVTRLEDLLGKYETIQDAQQDALKAMRQDLLSISKDPILSKSSAEINVLSSKLAKLDAARTEYQAILDTQQNAIGLLEQGAKSLEADQTRLYDLLQEKEISMTPNKNQTKVLTKIEEILDQQQKIVAGLDNRLGGINFQTGVATLTNERTLYALDSIKGGRIRSIQKLITFAVPFVHVPQVSVALQSFDTKDTIANLSVTHVQTDYFILNAEIYCHRDLQLRFFDVMWNAVSLGKPAELPVEKTTERSGGCFDKTQLLSEQTKLSLKLLAKDVEALNATVHGTRKPKLKAIASTPSLYCDKLGLWLFYPMNDDHIYSSPPTKEDAPDQFADMYNSTDGSLSALGVKSWELCSRRSRGIGGRFFGRGLTRSLNDAALEIQNDDDSGSSTSITDQQRLLIDQCHSFEESQQVIYDISFDNFSRYQTEKAIQLLIDDLQKLWPSMNAMSQKNAREAAVHTYSRILRKTKELQKRISFQPETNHRKIFLLNDLTTSLEAYNFTGYCERVGLYPFPSNNWGFAKTDTQTVFGKNPLMADKRGKLSNLGRYTLGGCGVLFNDPYSYDLPEMIDEALGPWYLF